MEAYESLEENIKKKKPMKAYRGLIKTITDNSIFWMVIWLILVILYCISIWIAFTCFFTFVSLVTAYITYKVDDDDMS